MTAAEKMTALARTFPQLAEHNPPGLDPWDVHAFGEWVASGIPGGGARRAGVFVLSVWNADAPESFGLGHFDIHEALGAWDRHHRAAFLVWAAEPWWA